MGQITNEAGFYSAVLLSFMVSQGPSASRYLIYIDVGIPTRGMRLSLQA